MHELATDGPDGTFHLVAGRNATTVGRLLELSATELRPPGAARVPAAPVPALAPPAPARGADPRLRRMEVYFPYFSMRVRFDDRRHPPAPPVEGYFHRLVRLRRARPLGARRWSGAGSPTLGRVIEKLVEQIESRFAELSEQMSDPEVIGDQRRYAEVGRAYRALEPAHAAGAGVAPRHRRRRGRARAARRGRRRPRAARDAAHVRGAARRARGGDPARDGRARPERRQGRDRRDPPRHGRRGGRPVRRRPVPDADRYAERRGFKTEPIEVGDGHFTFAVKGQGAYSVFKYEGGTHRVQRVPETESQGRIHTSTATVAVLPEAEDVDVHIDPNDLQIDVYRSSGPGRAVGEHHRLGGADHAQADRPRGLDAGREVAAPEPRQGDARAARAAARARAGGAAGRSRRPQRLAQVGSGERAEKIRTYNFPQDRVTDHRVGLTKGNLPGVLAGELDEFTAALEAEEKRRMLEAASRWADDGPRRARRGDRRARRRPAAMTPRLDAELLIADALGVGRERLFLDPDMAISAAGRARASASACGGATSASRWRTSSGARASGDIELQVDERVLIPRPETRAAGRGGARAARRARACTTWAPARAPSRWRCSTSGRTCG